jgi:glycosyltransferase involved in cell wall biosynthesis
MDISVIIPVYNSEKTIRKCVSSILNSDFNKSFEIIVVNDGSKDSSIDKIKDLNVRIINQKNKGAAAARNNGMRHSKSDLVIFVDSDVVFLKDTLRGIYNLFVENGADYVTVRYTRRSLNKKWANKYKALADYYYNFDFIYSEEQQKKPIKQVVLGGGVEGYRKKVFNELGGYDENIKGASVERETLFSGLFGKFNMIGDGTTKTMHHFPDFKSLINIYFYRTFYAMELYHKSNFNKQPSTEKNLIRIGLAPLILISLFVSMILFLYDHHIFPFFVPGVLFFSYVTLHRKLYYSALMEYGLVFMFYTFVVNFFFSNLIALAGFLGTIRSRFKSSEVLK